MASSLYLFLQVVNLHSYWQSVYHHVDLSPSIDDGLKTTITSVGRTWSKTISNNTCTVEPKRTITATTYHVMDTYKFTLVHFKVIADSREVDIEVAFRPINMTYLVAPSALTKRIEELSVSSDFDQKEQISRNFPRILSPYSEPVLIYKFASSETTIIHNISCLWIDPTGTLSEITDISVDENAIIGHSKPLMKQPHLPGAWAVKLIQHDALIAEAKFLVTPLEFYSGLPITAKQAALIHGGSHSRVITDSFEKFLKSRYDETMLKAVSVSNAKRIGRELREWIDALFAKFYVVERMCAVKKNVEVCGVQMEECEKTTWSSYAPDPKSVIGEVNKTTGAFDIW